MIMEDSCAESRPGVVSSAFSESLIASSRRCIGSQISAISFLTDKEMKFGEDKYMAEFTQQGKRSKIFWLI